MIFKDWTQLSPNELSVVSQIFFKTSPVQSFSSEENKNKFYYKYFGYYLKYHANLGYVLISDQQIVGYICGVEDSKNAAELYELQPHYHLFEDFFDDYPAHLHINVHPHFTGHGHGHHLLSHFENSLKNAGIVGLHLITSPTARNRQFYAQNGYNVTCERNFNGTPLLLMAKSLKV